MLETFQSDSFGIKWVAQSSGRKSQDPSSRVSFRDNSSLRVFISFFRSLLFSLLFCVFQNFFRGREHLIIFSGQFEPKNVPIFPAKYLSENETNKRQTEFLFHSSARSTSFRIVHFSCLRHTWNAHV